MVRDTAMNSDKGDSLNQLFGYKQLSTNENQETLMPIKLQES